MKKSTKSVKTKKTAKKKVAAEVKEIQQEPTLLDKLKTIYSDKIFPNRNELEGFREDFVLAEDSGLDMQEVDTTAPDIIRKPTSRFRCSRESNHNADPDLINNIETLINTIRDLIGIYLKRDHYNEVITLSEWAKDARKLRLEAGKMCATVVKPCAGGKVLCI